MSEHRVDLLLSSFQRGELSRRELVNRLVLLGLSVPAINLLVPAPVAAAQPSGELIIAQGPEITNLDGSMTTGMLTFNVVVNFMEPLVMRGADLHPHPHLAESVEQVDESTVRFTIREGVTFHNGDPLTVDDVVFTLERISNPDQGSDLYRYANTVTSVEAIDDRVVEVTLSEPDVTFITRMTLVPIVPRAVVEELGDAEFDANPMGTGPYRFVSWERGDRVTLEAYEDYWGDPAAIQTLVFRGIPEDATRMAEVQTGAAGLVTNVPTHLVPELESSDNTVVQDVNSLRTMFCILNTHKAPFDNVLVRQAANYAVDKELIAVGLMDGYATPTTQPFGPEVFGYNPEAEGSYAHDPDRARELLAEAGYADGVEVNFFSPAGRYLKDEEVVQTIAAQLQEVGFEVNVNFMEWQAFSDTHIQSGEPSPDLDIAFYSNANNTGDADYNLSLNVHSGNRGVYWNSPETDAMIDEARQVVDEAERLALYHQIIDLMIEEAPWIYLYTQHDIYAATSSLQGWEARPDEMIDLRGVSLDG